MGFRDRMNRFMQGRYGVDQLNRFLLYVAMALVVLLIFVRGTAGSVLSLIELLVVIWAIYRMMSRNGQRRYAENQKYLAMTGRIRDFFRGGTRAARDREHAYFRCPNCHQMVRVPRGKGHIQITCPRCHTQFIEET